MKISSLIQLTKRQKIIVCSVAIARIITFPIIILSFLHSLIIRPFHERYLFKKIEKFSIITTGGTGGHLFPAIRLATYINLKNKNIKIITNENALPLFQKLGYIHKKCFFYTEETQECPDAIPIVTLKVQPLRKNVSSFFAFLKAMAQALYFVGTRSALIENIIGFGGYVSFPVLFWGAVFRKKIHIHEQNTVFGKVNEMFFPFANHIFTAFPMEKKYHPSHIITYTGMPLQRSVEQRGFVKKVHSGNLKILVISGSSGGDESSSSIVSGIINFAKKYKDGTVTVLHQASGSTAKEIVSTYDKHNISHTIKPFFENIHSLLPEIDLCISRSGASSIVDLLSCGVTTIFVPLQTSADNHQLKNAAWVVHNNLGFMHKPWESNFYNLTALIYFALTASKRLNISKNSQTTIKRNTRALIFDYIF